jgi:hypothetical protein
MDKVENLTTLSISILLQNFLFLEDCDRLCGLTNYLIN